MTKRLITILFCLLLSAGIVFGLPLVLGNDRGIAADHLIENSILEQKIISYSADAHVSSKLYRDGRLVGVISDRSVIDQAIADQYRLYEEDFPDTELGLGEGLSVVEETSCNEYENIDENIIDYLISNRLLGIRTKSVEFSTAEGVYDVIYVKNVDDFYKARDTFLLNFISDESLDSLRAGEAVASPSVFGSVDTNIRISEKMTMVDAVAAPEDIMTTMNEIYTYFCYGRNETREWYEVRVGENLQGVGYNNRDMSPRQIMMLNPEIIFSEDQVIAPGTMLNVAYFTSPITVTVTKQRLAQETINADNPEYREDNTLVSGSRRIDVEEVSGLKNVLYEETWVNGVNQGGSEVSSVVIREPIRAVISVGTMRVPDVGTGNFIWPTDHPKITCMWGCYFGHTGTDIVNTYERYGMIYAADTGVVEKVSYDGISGNYIVIDHQNGFRTYYGHCSEIYAVPGQTVQRGETIAKIGTTGLVTGPHVHFHFIIDGQLTNACLFMNCGSIPGGY